MNVGSIVLATEQGVGLLARSFYDNALIHRVLVNRHHRRTNHLDWYPGACYYDPARVDDFLDGLDALLIIEKIPRDQWWVMARAKERGIVTTLIPMYECTPDPLPVEPHQFICPSLLDLECYRGRKTPAIGMPVPVDVRWRRRRRARVFVHNAGNAQGFFRNGTMELLAALPKVRSPIKLILRMREPFGLTPLARGYCETAQRLIEAARADDRVELVEGGIPFQELWRDGDVFVFPEKWNGLSLPLQEARASGMLVMASDRFPSNAWLPEACLIPVSGYRQSRVFGVSFREAVIDSDAIAATIDRWFDADLQAYSEAGRAWAREHSWKRWRQPYLDALSGID